jgi:ABC-2 type transport system permease protein
MDRSLAVWARGITRPSPAIYQLDVTADGRYVADGDGPKEVNGYFLVRTSTGDTPNPVWQFDGNVDLFASTTKE